MTLDKFVIIKKLIFHFIGILNIFINVYYDIYYFNDMYKTSISTTVETINNTTVKTTKSLINKKYKYKCSQCKTKINTYMRCDRCKSKVCHDCEDKMDICDYDDCENRICKKCDYEFCSENCARNEREDNEASLEYY